MDPSIKKILRDHYIEGTFHTHVSMVGQKGKYQFSRNGLENLWTTYCDLIRNDKNTVIGLAEKSQYFLPVLGDIDIKLVEKDNEDFGDNIITEDHILSVVEVYQSILRKIVNNITDKQLICVLLEKPLYRITKNEITYVKNGFHLHFPGIFLSKVDQEVHLIPRIKKAIDELNVFKDIGIQESSSVIDKAVCSVPWLMYGSRKSDDMEPYTISTVYNKDLEPIEIEDAFHDYKIYDDKENLIDLKGQVEYYLPRILSILPYNRDTHEIRNGLVSPLKQQIRERKKKKTNTVSLTKALELAKTLIPLLSDQRSRDRNEWLNVGWVIFNIGDGTPEALDLWLEFSSRAEEEYDEAACIYQWDRMVKKDLTLGTLCFYASVDSPEEYKRFKIEQVKNHIEDSLLGSHNDIAKALHAEHGQEFVCASITNKIWFQYTNHIWEQIEEGVFLRQKISSDLVTHFCKMNKEILLKMAELDEKSGGEKANLEERYKKVQKMIGSLKSAPYKQNVMKEAMEVFYDKRFREKLDTNPYIIAFQNGVYDLKLNVFRPGKPEDFLSKNLPINYNPNFTQEDQAVREVHDFLEKVFPDKSVRRYFLDTSCEVFTGGNNDKKVIFWTGEGDNAKSITQLIFEKMLGKLAIKFNTSVLTGKKVGAGSANADLARAGGGVRWAVLEEPDGDEQINVGTLKHLSGNDSFYARDLFERGKDGREIVPMFKLAFICNVLPELKYADKATWNRVEVLPFESTFSKDAPETWDEQLRQKIFPVDTSFSKKIPGLVEAFAWVLLEHRKTVKVRFVPEKVKAATAIYRKQNDFYRQFAEEFIEETEQSNILTIDEIWVYFKEWYRDSYPHHSQPVKIKVRDQYIKILGNPCPEYDGIAWAGFRIKDKNNKKDPNELMM